MTDTTKPVFLEAERKLTDDSLVSERGKTDESFGAKKKSAEEATDQSVKADRREADENRESRRSAADLKVSETGRSRLGRQDEDDALNIERKLADKALVHERKEKEKAFVKVFDDERNATDKNLSHERSESDLKVSDSAGLLTAEQSAHSATKISLTTREEFMAIVSHDLRNPIGAISSSTELLSREPSFMALDEGPKKLLAVAQRNANEALRLIADLMDTDRINQGKLSLTVAEFNITALVNEAVENFALTASAKSIELLGIPADSSTMAICDRARIAQVLSNLLGNALKFTPRGGSVTVGAASVGDGSGTKVFVKDTGPGITSDQQERIFKRFAQLENQNRTGLGLGLYISNQLIEAQGGKLWVESMVGEGSAFHFTLPSVT